MAVEKPPEKLSGKLLDEARRFERDKLNIRGDRRSAPDLDEDSAVIHLEAEQRARLRAQPISSVPPRAKTLIAILHAVPERWRGPFAFALVGLLAFVAWLAGPALVDWLK